MSYTIYTDPPQSRNEAILKSTIDGTQYTDPPQSRIEDLLKELKAAIEGGGGGGTTNYNALENRPQVNGHTLEGDMSFEDLGIDETPTEDSANAVASGGVYAGLADKIDKSSTGYQTITGNPLEFDSPSPQMVNMKCDIVASQDLHGYDKPWAGGAESNKAEFTETPSAEKQYFTYSSNVENDITAVKDDYSHSAFFARFEIESNGGTYTLNASLGENVTVYGYTDELYGTEVFSAVESFPLTVTLPQGTIIIGFYAGWNVTQGATVYVRDFRANEGESDIGYEPYSNICPISGVDTIDIDVAGGESYTIDLDGTRYGGQLDVGSGVLTLTHGEIASYDGETLPSEWISDRDEYQAGTTPTTGAQVVYELATPQTVQLTPTQVWAVQGGNTITVSVDGVEAEIHSSNYATLQDINDLWDYIKQSPQGGDGVKFGASNLEMIGGTMP